MEESWWVFLSRNWTKLKCLLAVTEYELMEVRSKSRNRSSPSSGNGVLRTSKDVEAEPSTRVRSMKRKSREDLGKKPMEDAVDAEPKKKLKEKETNKKVQKVNDLMQVVPDLPERFRTVIKEMQGNDHQEPILVIQKRLFASDLVQNNNRLSVPLNQVRTEFLTPEENRSLDNNSKLSVNIIEPSLQVSDITLTRWEMRKSNGKINYMYAFISTWTAINKRNRLRVGDVIQLWAFRKADGTFAFALVKLDGDQAGSSSGSGNNDGAGTSGSHGEEDGNGNSGDGNGSPGTHGGEDGNANNDNGAGTSGSHGGEDGNGNSGNGNGSSGSHGGEDANGKSGSSGREGRRDGVEEGDNGTGDCSRGREGENCNGDNRDKSGSLDSPTKLAFPFDLNEDYPEELLC
ncbi:putative B3 domain-containing protein At2g27410 [Carica papaya]|uniref:putative B3 domain-containing protein At2g27410 n=1 Tax=Carica papaya TaxID=3649 RepID=UPI000B8CF13D|nr:putative B3 domain-containing protein At2g27410 [Carica papaya]